jgi:predicted transcriptional regulator
MEFLAPAQFGSQVHVANATWLFILFDQASSATGRLSFPDGSSLSSFNESYFTMQEPALSSNSSFSIPHPATNRDLTQSGAEMLVQGKTASIYLEAEKIEWSTWQAAGTVDLRSPNVPLDDLVNPWTRDDRAARYEVLEPDGSVVVWTNASTMPEGFSLATTNLHLLETHGVSFSCDNDEIVCPNGADRSMQSNSLANVDAGAGVLSFHRFSMTTGQLQLSGSAQIVGGGNDALDLSVNGGARFPLATFDCGECAGPKDETLTVDGVVHLKELSAKGNGRLGGEFKGDLSSARVDEQSVEPLLLGTVPLVASVAAGTGLAFVVKLLLAPLFTRLTKEQALEHPRRKQIFEYIQQHPGANFREVARNTGIAAGTVRHHLNVLERSGQVVEHSHGSTVRLFENHGKFDQNWSDLVLLREPALGKLHEWLKAHPNSPQKAVLEAMEAEQWSRSTTQHRLSRLVEGGVVSIRLQGRLKMYSVVEKPVGPRPLLGAVAGRPAAS